MHLANGFHPRGWVQGFIIIVDRAEFVDCRHK